MAHDDVGANGAADGATGCLGTVIVPLRLDRDADSLGKPPLKVGPDEGRDRGRAVAAQRPQAQPLPFLQDLPRFVVHREVVQVDIAVMAALAGDQDEPLRPRVRSEYEALD